ncbi:MAG: type VI secretion protein IcmF [Legionella sp.]|nr:type VI secretion protein IcmF [Legionella sp.]
MDNSLQALCDAIKKILQRLKPQSNPLSFILIIGKQEQGKSAVLKQSRMEEIPVLSEQHAKIYYNQNGIALELGESWFINSKTLLQNTLKQLNRCSAYLKISGLVLCVDVNDLLIADPSQFAAQKKSHIQALERIGMNLGYLVELAIMCTKMDSLAGFCEFYQTDHAMDLAKPLGFSLDCINKYAIKKATFSQHFGQLIELIGQQVIQKMHPARSTIKRSLIREFPLQLASLQLPIQSLIQGISCKLFNLHSIYFTSAEQGGVSIDRLNKKIQHEYALVVQDTFPQAVNFRSFFIEGAIKTIQEQCKQSIVTQKFTQKPLIAITLSLAGFSLLLLFWSHFKTTHLLDDASKELISYGTLTHQGNPQALYHLSKASDKLEHISSNSLILSNVYQLKSKLSQNTEQRLQSEFLPSLANELESTINNPSDTPTARYKALKVYLMLSQAEHFVAQEVYDWFKQQRATQHTPASNNQMSLLKQILSKPQGLFPIKQQVITDARNYLNALPTGYFYYSLAKEQFPKTEEKIAFEGFNLATTQLPVYFTKSGFHKVIEDIPNIVQKLQAENWVLAHQNLSQLQEMLTQAYCFNYVSWWRTFMQNTQPLHYQAYQSGHDIVNQLHQSNGLAKLIQLVQQETKLDILDRTSSFNQLIANQFTDLNLISLSSIKELEFKITDLKQFLATLSLIQDDGRTAFGITKSRFVTETSSDPIGSLFNLARQFPEPLKTWTQQLAADTWFLLIKDTRNYINKIWKQTVYTEFNNKIAQRYPFYSAQPDEITLTDFNHFFSTHGVLNSFTQEYIKPFLDISNAEWKPKVVNEAVLPIASDTLDEIIRANIITNMFYPDGGDTTNIHFSLQKISLDPVVSSLLLEIGDTKLTDNQGSDSSMQFTWPKNDAKLALNSIEGNHYEIAEHGPWALFKLLEKVNVLVDEQDSSSLQILFEVNGNSGRYLLKTDNKVNPFTPGILNGFILNDVIV